MLTPYTIFPSLQVDSCMHIPRSGSRGLPGTPAYVGIQWQAVLVLVISVGTKAIDVPTTDRLTPLLCGYGELPIPAQTKILFEPVERPERRESTNKAIPLKLLNA